MENENKSRRAIADIMTDFLDGLSENEHRFVLNEKAKAAAAEMVRDHEWRDERGAEYKEHIIEQANMLGIDTVSACVYDMLQKITGAPTTIHMISVPRLIMPILLEFIEGKQDDGK